MPKRHSFHFQEEDIDMKRIAFSLGLLALSLPLSLEAKPVGRLVVPSESNHEKERMSFSISGRDGDWSVETGIIQSRPKTEQRLDRHWDNQRPYPKRVLGIILSHKF